MKKDLEMIREQKLIFVCMTQDYIAVGWKISCSQSTKIKSIETINLLLLVASISRYNKIRCKLIFRKWGWFFLRVFFTHIIHQRKILTMGAHGINSRPSLMFLMHSTLMNTQNLYLCSNFILLIMALLHINNPTLIPNQFTKNLSQSIFRAINQRTKLFRYCMY